MRFTIKLKLGLTFATIVVLSTVTAVLGVSSLASLDSNLQSLVQGPVERQRLALELNNSLLAMVRAEKNLVLSETKEEIDRSDAEIGSLRQEFLSKIDKVEAIATAEGRPKWAALRAA